jgi:hypothetical protein
MAALAPNTIFEAMGQPTEEGKDIIAIGFRECRFPIGAKDDHTMFCARRTPEGATYCLAHQEKMYAPKKQSTGRPIILPR